MDAVYPAAASALARGRRVHRAAPRLRHRTAPVTFAEIKEVDEDKEVEVDEGAGGAGGVGGSRGSLVSVGSVCEERRRRPDVLGERFDQRLDREFAAFRRRRARRQPLREPDETAATPDQPVAPPPPLAASPPPPARPSDSSDAPEGRYEYSSGVLKLN